ncbi:MAG TPA: XRE family transcriptional regulator [Gammaproteobacteria bacterium]|nr:XRE family transcriptional regulator [Gammaproteobacteria bacterium]
MTDPKKILAENLRRLRTSAGLSQEELADRAGLHRTYVSSVERAQRNVTLENVFALAKALGTTPSELVRLPDEGGQ